MSVGNALGRVVHGSLCDRFGFLPVLHGMCAASAVALATFTLGAPSKALFTAWCIVTAFFYGGNFALYPTATVALFGREHFGANYGFVFVGFGVCGVLITLVNKLLCDQIGYLGMTLICGAFSFAGLLLSLFTRRAARRAQRRAAEALLWRSTWDLSPEAAPEMR